MSYGDDPEKVKKVTLDVINNIPNQASEREVELFYEGFGNSSIDFVLRVWFSEVSQREYKYSISSVIMKIKKAYDENDITIPFPIRTLDFGIKVGAKLPEMFGSNSLIINTDQ